MRLTHLDLIDTLWNVKKTRCYKALGLGKDLIDTLWNVKLILRQYHPCTYQI